MSTSWSEQSHLLICASQLIAVSAVSNGKYGTFQANDIIGRPYYLTFEICDALNNKAAGRPNIRVIPAAELYEDIKEECSDSPCESDGSSSFAAQDGVQYDVVGQDGEVVMRTNRKINDDPGSQIMTMAEIEAVKAQSTGSGKELVAKILDSHSALDQKSAFALAKYTLRKTKKYLKRFTVLPLDVSLLARWMLTEKEPMKIMELREEILALISSWSNVHHTPSDPAPFLDGETPVEQGRWLIIDETAGLLVACMAERMGVLYPSESLEEHPINGEDMDLESKQQDGDTTSQQLTRPHKIFAPALTNTITLIHANAQPNLSLLKYFHFDAFNPSSNHPLERHLKTISWLQLLSPEEDISYREPEVASEDVIRSWKSGKRSHYFRKRRRWERIKFIVNETRAGNFDGLVVASVMNPVSVLRHTVPLLRGAAQVVVYSPTIEPLVELADYYSTARRTAFVTNPPDPELMPTEDFPLNPTLLLAPTIQTARCRNWQVLPGRTHPLMTGRGGSEGYVFTATRVLPAEGKIEARGKFKRRKVESATTAPSSQQGSPVAESRVR